MRQTPIVLIALASGLALATSALAQAPINGAPPPDSARPATGSTGHMSSKPATAPKAATKDSGTTSSSDTSTAPSASSSGTDTSATAPSSSSDSSATTPDTKSKKKKAPNSTATQPGSGPVNPQQP